MDKIYYSKLILILLLSFTANSQTSNFAAAVLRLNHSAYHVALGNAGSADYSGQADPRFHLSTAGDNLTDIIQININEYSLDRKLYEIAFLSYARKRIYFAIGLSYFTVDNLYSYNNLGEKGDAILYSDWIYSLSFGFKLSSKLRLSSLFQFNKQEIADYFTENLRQQFFTNNMSLHYRIVEDLQIAFTVKDILISSSNNSEKVFETTHEESLKPYSVLALSGQIFKFISALEKSRFHLDYKMRTYYPNSLHVGIEFNDWEQFPIRFGIDNDALTAGFGLRFEMMQKEFHFNYAYHNAYFGENSSHFFSWRVLL